jgi:hypothetical protein
MQLRIHVYIPGETSVSDAGFLAVRTVSKKSVLENVANCRTHRIAQAGKMAGL